MRRLITLGFIFFASSNAYALETGIKKIMINMLEKSAVAGEKDAQVRLGTLYIDGTDEGYLKAASWYRRAALQGYGPAQYNLARLFEIGQGVEEIDLAMALWLYEKAANQRIDDALYRMALIYERLNDFGQAFYYYSLASRKEIWDAKVALGIILKRGRWLEINSENDQKALYLFLEASRANNNEGTYQAARMLEIGRGEAQDLTRAAALYALAATNGHLDALKRLAIMPK